MKTFVSLIITSLITLLKAQGQVQTIAVNSTSGYTNGVPYSGGVLNVDSNSFATLKSFIGPNAILQINTQGATVTLNNQSLTSLAASPVVIAGPATIQIQQQSTSAPGSFATFSVEPAPFPPGKTATVGAYAGNVQVTMQISTDLVNWTPAVNGQVYTNSPTARFFRIQLATNIAP